MKKQTITLMALMFSIGSMVAQTANPRGLFKLQKFVYDDGTELPANFEQYKFCGDNVTLQVYVHAVNPDGTMDFSMANVDGTPLNYTGKKPVGKDGHGTQIFDSNSEGFSLRWFNNRYLNNALFPFNRFTT